MTILKITTEGNPILRRSTREIKPEEFGSAELKRLVSDMVETMVNAKGVGIAAPQVNQSLRLCVVETADGPAVLANPLIVWRSNKTEIEAEGCLSCPGKEVKVERAKRIEVSAQTVEGEAVRFPAEGYLARIIQHEIDHLDGILIIDKKTP